MLSTENPYENWVQETVSMLLSSESGKPFNGWIEHAPWYWLATETEKVIRKGKESVFNKKITQSKSQKVRQIFQVLSQINEQVPINTTSIKNRSGLSWDAVNRTLHLLRKEKVVIVSQHEDRKNNEKFYILDKNRAINYQKNLIFWKGLKDSIKWVRKENSKLNQQIKIDKRFPEDFLDWPINLTPDAVRYLKTTKNKTRIGDLPVSQGRRLMINYLAGLYCYDCFENGDISKVKIIGEISCCQLCGKEIDYEDENVRKPISYKGWELTKKMYKIENQYKKKEVSTNFI